MEQISEATDRVLAKVSGRRHLIAHAAELLAAAEALLDAWGTGNLTAPAQRLHRAVKACRGEGVGP